MPETKAIPLHLIDEPEIAMRSEIDDDYIQSLAGDIGRNGLINPISVVPNGERFRIIAGHCRYLAHKLMARDTIECKVWDGVTADTEGIKFAENFYRAEVSDADIAVFLSDVQLKYHYNMDELKRMTGRSEAWIEQRLSLFTGDQAVFNALQSKQIKLGHALELNKFSDEHRAYYLDVCITSTPPIGLLQKWRADLRLQSQVQTTAAPAEAAPAEGMQAAAVVVDCCEFCSGNQAPWDMTFVRIHKTCLASLKAAVAQAERG